MDKGQTGRFSKGEMDLIRNTFKDEEVLYAIRSVFFGFPAKEIKLTDDALAIVKKIMIPELTADVPLGQQADLYFSLNLKEVALPEIAALHIQARDLATEYLVDRFQTLKTGTDYGVTLDSLKNRQNLTDEDRYIGMLAYFFLTNAYVDSCLAQLRTLANSREMTDEEKKAQAEQNSNK